MSNRKCLLAGLLLVAACGDVLDPDRDPRFESTTSGLTQSVTYIGKQQTTNFVGYGQHLQYWPLFGLASGQTARRTDDSACIEHTPEFASFNHHHLPEGRTFSNDALGSPIGTKTRGGYATWPMFTLPDGTVGRSGTFYDESNVDNSNNTVNQLRINVDTLTEFCVNIITDNTDHEHDADVRLEARSDDIDVPIPPADLTFDGQTDMYTFRYTGMAENDLVKIRFQCSSASGCLGAGLGGIMVSHISTCTQADPGDPMPDAGTGGDPDDPPSSMSPDDDPRGHGGCNAGSSAGFLAAIAVLFAVRVRRSRRRPTLARYDSVP